MPEGGDHWWVGHCIVAPRRRGNGIGLHMVRLLLDRAFDARNARRVSLIVFPSNFDAVRCYRAAGFSERREVYREFVTRPGRHRMLYMSIDRRRHESLRGRLI
jgi:RimJ/RimL family protein N-acetyltransferase